MTRKDYVEIAKVLKSVKDLEFSSTLPPTPAFVAEYIAKELIPMLKRDNPAFDKARFLAACGF